MFALNNKEWIVLKLSPAVRKTATVIYPLVSIMENMVKKMVALSKKIKTGDTQHNTLHELRAAASLARQAKIMGAQEERIVISAAMLSSRTVNEIIIPIEDVTTIHQRSRLSEALIKAHMDMHTRFPVCAKENDPQTIEGYINFKDIVAALKNNPANPTVQGITRPIKRIIHDKPLSKLLEEMIQEKIHIGIVTDSDNRVIGLVTLEDILEELVGNIENVYERLPVHIYAYESSWIIGGSASMQKICELTGICLPAPAETAHCTLAEWWQKQTGTEFKESVNIGNYTITARKYKRKKVAEAIITKK